MSKLQLYDVIIVGGSYAGLSAAMTLGRAKRYVLVIDDNNPCNRQTPHSHNLITHDGEPPAEIRRKALEQVMRYDTVSFYDGTAIAVNNRQTYFETHTSQGDVFSSKKIIFTTGVTDIMPSIKGFAECWGISVLHCPYCHGYEVKDTPLAVIANEKMAYEYSRLIHHWSKDLKLFTNGKSTLAEEQTAALRSHGIEIIEDEITELQHKGGELKQLIVKSGKAYPLTAVFAKAPFTQHCTIPQQLGCELNEQGLIRVDDFQHTNVHGIFAAGDNSTLFRSVGVVIAAGIKAGAMANHQLIEEEFR
ncbi:NAD(P)/FAD-dependent oxidoreductase [Terrimonas sp. NA20]|uniref:NAD(P)/FAD-dependent oxidoreductase n=1 Tax=Terrimonas ginsenosidimutans TaxID=2908004 RepID=A0ABS9L060_9BACT|nr:NAD(P)/FAD-dependent oxidoreductase [Terrimonas ginsenosidimutans]MCG2618007.1 NAD(P)/FAD-dependent oxidoreductase [Terrimonas ginsenosidimutans]